MVVHTLEFALIQWIVVCMGLIQAVRMLVVRSERSLARSLVQAWHVALAPFSMMLIRRQFVTSSVVEHQWNSDWPQPSWWLLSWDDLPR